MKMTRKLNNDNGLQDWKTEHQAVTKAKCNKGFSGLQRFVARLNFSCNSTVNHPQSLTALSLNR